VRAHLLEILPEKASLVAAGIRRSATLREMAAAERKPLNVCADYLVSYAPYLQYDKALAEGLPNATGVIEGACRHLVKDRMNVSGARWSLARAEAVLRLRALRASIGSFTSNRSTNATTHRDTPIITCRMSFRPPASSSQPSLRGTLKIVKKGVVTVRLSEDEPHCLKLENLKSRTQLTSIRSHIVAI
jgi:hypothetical protein